MHSRRICPGRSGGRPALSSAIARTANRPTDQRGGYDTAATTGLYGRVTCDRTCMLALWVVEQALHACQYTGPLKQPQPGLRLALAHLYAIAGDDPGIAPRSRAPFDALWRLVMNTDGEQMGNGDRARSTYARTEYARIRRMVGYPETIENDERLRQFMGR